MTLTYITEATDLDALLAPYTADEETEIDFITLCDELKTGEQIATVEILSETEKAYKVYATVYCSVGRTTDVSGVMYLPKKCTKLVQGDDLYAIIPTWLAKAKVLEIKNKF